MEVYQSNKDESPPPLAILSSSPIRTGSVNIAAFERWLEQDYLFVRAFGASVLIKAYTNSNKDSDMEVLLHGMSASNDEIAWFPISGVYPYLLLLLKPQT